MGIDDHPTGGHDQDRQEPEKCPGPTAQGEGAKKAGGSGGVAAGKGVEFIFADEELPFVMESIPAGGNLGVVRAGASGGEFDGVIDDPGDGGGDDHGSDDAKEEFTF